MTSILASLTGVFGKLPTAVTPDNGNCLALLLYAVSTISVSLIKYIKREAVRLAKPCVEALLKSIEGCPQRAGGGSGRETVQQQSEEIGWLKDEIAVLKGEKAHPKFKPSGMGTGSRRKQEKDPSAEASDAQTKRPWFREAEQDGGDGRSTGKLNVVPRRQCANNSAA